MKITCRICKIQQGEFFTLDSVVLIHSQNQHKLLEIFNKCFQLNASLQDSLPQVVCLVCLEKLKEFFEFQLQAEQTDLELRKIQNTHPHMVKPEIFENPVNTSREETNEAIVTKTKVEEEAITTEDDDDDHCCEDDKITQADQEEIEDTDILFELYNKNDSHMEIYLKCDKIENEHFIKDCSPDAGDDVIENEIHQTNDIISGNSEIESNKLHIDKPSLANEASAETIEISRIEFPKECPQVKTLMLEPLIEFRKWQCLDCGRKYLTEEKLKQHQKLHNNSEGSQCEICGSHIKSLYEYREHMKEHGTERKFSCEFCDKAFSTRANLKAHLFIHTNLRPFKCEICGKTFQQKSILKTHMTLHTGKPFECTLCQRRFSRTAHLNIHMRQHNNVRPYQCTQCPSSYMQKSHLDRHISSSHLGVRFQCTVCGKMYTKKSSLSTHMREAHCTTVSLYNCDICDLDFPKQKALYYHMKSKHPGYKKNEN